MRTNQKAVAILSGGMDSTTLVHLLDASGFVVHALSFNYGQRHSKELMYASGLADELGLRHDIIDLTSVGRRLTGSALTDEDVGVPHGYYAAENMKTTVVPNRNAMMLAVAFAVASAEEAPMVAAGFHGGDHDIYPDCRPEFVQAFGVMQQKALEGFFTPFMYVPFLHKSKHNIVALGQRLGVLWDETWSCYEGGDIHCGRCGTCVERKEAFYLASVADTTRYVDEDYMKHVVAMEV